MECSVKVLHLPGEPDMPAFAPGSVECWRAAPIAMQSAVRASLTVESSVERGFFAPISSTKASLGGGSNPHFECAHTVAYESNSPSNVTVHADSAAACSGSALIAIAVMLTWYRARPDLFLP